MSEQMWLIEARFKSVGGPWIPQAMEPFMESADAEAKVDQLRQRNTLSEWRARRYGAEPSPEPEAAPASEAQAPAVPRYRINCEGELEESSRFGILVTVEDHLAEVASLREKLAQAEHKGWSDAIEAVVTMLTSVFGWHKNSRGIDAIRSLAKREKE